MRRMVLGTVAAFAVAMLAAGAGSGAEPTPDGEAASDDVLFLRTSEGVALVREAADGAAVDVPGAVPAIDWSALVRAVPGDGATRVEAIDPDSGDVMWASDVPGSLEVKVASAQAAMVALGDPEEGAGYAFGRTSTTLVILDRGLPEPRTIELEGNYAPEAFSTDGRSLFVVEYLPPQRPTSYRVRRLDLATEQVEGVYTVDQELQDSMQGTARIQAASPDGRRLYTLYTQEVAGGWHTFVHVLSLDELWAHCIDLPASFAGFDERAMAIAVSPDGSRLYVADASSGTVAEADTETLAVTRTAEIPFWSRGGIAHGAAGPHGSLYLAKGKRVVAVDAGTLTADGSWEVQGRVNGMQVSDEGDRVFVGLSDEISILDAASGALLEVVDPLGIEAIRQLGTSTRDLEEERTTTSCAC
jgi:YVTN family beta-propeller protein